MQNQREQKRRELDNIRHELERYRSLPATGTVLPVSGLGVWPVMSQLKLPVSIGPTTCYSKQMRNTVSCILAASYCIPAWSSRYYAEAKWMDGMSTAVDKCVLRADAIAQRQQQLAREAEQAESLVSRPCKR